MTGSHDLTISLSHSPGSVLQVGMRQMTLITAHFAAYIHKHAVFAPGLGYVAALGTVVQEMSHCYDQYLQLSYLSALIYLSTLSSCIAEFVCGKG